MLHTHFPVCVCVCVCVWQLTNLCKNDSHSSRNFLVFSTPCKEHTHTHNTESRILLHQMLWHTHTNTYRVYTRYRIHHTGTHIHQPSPENQSPSVPIHSLCKSSIAQVFQNWICPSACNEYNSSTNRQTYIYTKRILCICDVCMTLLLHVWDRCRERGPNVCFSSRSLKCPLHMHRESDNLSQSCKALNFF